MKFAQTFRESLQRGEYPQQWVDSAISYRKLKKCIKRVQQELQSLGLDRKTLEAVWQQINPVDNDGTANSEGKEPPLRYAISGDQVAIFTPKLTIAIDPRDGTPMDAWLSPETRSHLRNLAYAQGSHRRRSVASLQDSNDQREILEPRELDHQVDPPEQENGALSDSDDFELLEQVETIEIPLTSDSEFFQILNRELSNLEILQRTEQDRLKARIIHLGKEIGSLKSTSSKKSKKNVEAWREIFRLYTESQIFFSSNEQDAGTRGAAKAQKQLQLFSKTLEAERGRGMYLDKNASASLERFLEINANLLRFITFQEINRTALFKIMKKFDKQTALKSQVISSKWLTSAPFMAQDLAKATCFTISEELLHIIPQLDDYLCPVCFSVSFKPIRLRCNHVFCIRCLIVMQRAEQNHCPLCRGDVVLEATSDNLDSNLMSFLKANFPEEVKAKQKANELAAGVDRFGEGFEKTHQCAIM